MSQHRDDEPVLAERTGAGSADAGADDQRRRLGCGPAAARAPRVAQRRLRDLLPLGPVHRELGRPHPRGRDDTGLSTQGVGLVILGGAAGSILGLFAAPWLLARFGARAGMIGVL